MAPTSQLTAKFESVANEDAAQQQHWQQTSGNIDTNVLRVLSEAQMITLMKVWGRIPIRAGVNLELACGELAHTIPWFSSPRAARRSFAKHYAEEFKVVDGAVALKSGKGREAFYE